MTAISFSNLTPGRDPQETHIVVGMSGGVDSSVSAHLLKQKGYQVTGLFMKNWEEDDSEEYCAAAADLKDAQQVCEKMGIELQEVNFAHEYWENVFEHFLSEYQAGRTPNPDILCNKEIKFKEFLLQAEAMGADFIATGHYVAKGINGTHENPYFELLRGADLNKDQSYFLYTLQQAALAKSVFPLGEISKPLVREIASQCGFVTHDKKDSTGICFIGERRFKDFLSTYLKPNPGNMVTPEGKLIGEHDGLMYYTLGQRKGLDIGGAGEAWYVANKDTARNELIVVQGHDHPELQSSTVFAQESEWVNGAAPKIGSKVTAKTRYRQQDQECTIIDNDDALTVEFSQPQRAVTPGQALVLYDGPRCLGGATIQDTRR